VAANAGFSTSINYRNYIINSKNDTCWGSNGSKITAYDVFRFAIGFIGSFMIITLVYSLSLRRWKECPGSYLKELLSDAGQKSMGLYMLHSFGIRWYENMAIADNGIRYGYALFCSLAIYALAMFLTRLFEQWRITRLLFLGGR